MGNKKEKLVVNGAVSELAKTLGEVKKELTKIGGK